MGRSSIQWDRGRSAFQKKISELAVEVGKVDISHENFLMPVANFMTEENEDVETPDIVFKFRQ